jgi:hypothetical protein
MVFFLRGPLKLKTVAVRLRRRSSSRSASRTSFTLERKAAEDQHWLGSDSVNDIADLLVVQRQVDELRDFDVVDGDLGFVELSDNQVPLLRDGADQLSNARRKPCSASSCLLRCLPG